MYGCLHYRAELRIRTALHGRCVCVIQHSCCNTNKTIINIIYGVCFVYLRLLKVVLSAFYKRRYDIDSVLLTVLCSSQPAASTHEAAASSQTVSNPRYRAVGILPQVRLAGRDQLQLNQRNTRMQRDTLTVKVAQPDVIRPQL